MVKFRYNAAAAVAGLVATIGAIPLAAARWYLTPLLLVPLAVAVWFWRAGTDADAAGVRVRAALGSRFVPWSRIETLVVGQRQRVYAQTAEGTAVRLPAVSARELPRLIAAGSAAREDGGGQ